MDRTVGWDGVHNCRDLGGLPLPGGGTTRWHRFYRAPRLDVLTARGWQDLLDAGVRTVVDLRNADEIVDLPVPQGVRRHALPVEDQSDAAFMADWGRSLTTPDYYEAALARWPEKFAAVFTAMAGAPEGGIVFYCASGRDRTGLVAAMLLRLVGVDIGTVADDYEAGLRAVNGHLARQDRPREPALTESDLEQVVEAKRSTLEAFLADLDVAAYLRAAGVADRDLAALRHRLTGHDAETARENRAAYDAIADDHAERKRHRGVGEYVVEMLDLAMEHVPVGAVAVDVGCGHGHELALLAARGLRCVGLDRSAGMLRHAAAGRDGSPVVQGDALALPFADASVDLVASVHGLVHLAPSELPAAFRGIHRVLRPGGVAATSFLAGTDSSREEVDYAPGQHRTFTFRTASEITTAALDAGLHVLHMREMVDAGGTTWTVIRREPGAR